MILSHRLIIPITLPHFNLKLYKSKTKVGLEANKYREYIDKIGVRN